MDKILKSPFERSLWCPTHFILKFYVKWEFSFKIEIPLLLARPVWEMWEIGENWSPMAQISSV